MESTNVSTANHQNDKSHLQRYRKKQRQRKLAVPIYLSFVIVTCGLGFLVIIWQFSEQLLRVTRKKVYDLRIKNVTPDTVTIERSSSTQRRGTYGLDWPDGHAMVGEIIKSDATSVTRRLLATTPGLYADLHIRWDGFVYRGTPGQTYSLDYTEVLIPGPLGELPAWYIPGSHSTWIIMVHGYGVTREECLRIMPLLARLGFPMLDISYRNDIGAPASPDNLYHLGDSEWQDLEAAVRYSLAQGAEKIVLYGWSMGGNIVQSFVRRSPYAFHVQAVLLDSPVTDWRAILDMQAANRHLPEQLTTIVEWLISLRTGITFNQLDHIAGATKLTAPTLLFHGGEDTVVPVTTSDAFAKARPDLITYHRTADAQHTQLWNVDPQAYEAAVEAFLVENLGLNSEDVLEEGVLEA
jgi:pimeloyl-ACP methyl ester carboxylesterase